MKKGFTIAELLTTLGVVSIIIFVLLPVIKNAFPNRPMVMFKQTYYTTERIISELVSNKDIYPDVFDLERSPYLGNTQRISYLGETYEGDTKFCELFASKINSKSQINCSAEIEPFEDGVASDGQFVAANNVAYILPIESFNNVGFRPIYIDTNAAQGPNCMYNAESCKEPDRFTIKVNRRGNLCVDTMREVQYLNSNDIKKKGENYEDLEDIPACVEEAPVAVAP